MKVKNSREDFIFDVTVTVSVILALLITLYPLYFVVIASISDFNDIAAGKVIFLPSGINFDGYKFILENQDIWKGYRNTILYTFFGTIFGIAVTLLAGYALSRKDLVGRGWIMKIMIFTMFFNGGLIPTYLVVKNLNLINNPLVLIILGSVGVYHIIITRTFFQSTIPDELLEAAFMDGCGNFKFFVSIVLPLSKALVAVIALYYAVAHWNAYFAAMIYVTNKKLYPLQLFLRQILVIGQEMARAGNLDASEVDELAQRMKVAETIKYGVIIVSTLPVICLYPFLQKYFVKGVMIGSVKG